MPLVPTARLGLNTWTAGTDPFTRAQRNADAATIDELAAIAANGPFADRPAAGTRDSLYLVDDVGDPDHDGELYYDTGAAWRLVNTAPDLSGYATSADLAAGLAGKLGAGAKAADSDLLDGHDSAYFATAGALAATAGVAAAALPAGAKAADSEQLDGHDSTYFGTAAAVAGKLDAGAKAADSDKLDGLDSTAFARAESDLDSPRRYGRAFLLMGA